MASVIISSADSSVGALVARISRWHICTTMADISLSLCPRCVSMQMKALSTMSSIGRHVNGDVAAGHSTSPRTNAALPTAPTVATAVRPSVPNAPFDRASDTVMQNAAYLAAMSAHAAAPVPAFLPGRAFPGADAATSTVAISAAAASAAAASAAVASAPAASIRALEQAALQESSHGLRALEQAAMQQSPHALAYLAELQVKRATHSIMASQNARHTSNVCTILRSLEEETQDFRCLRLMHPPAGGCSSSKGRASLPTKRPRDARSAEPYRVWKLCPWCCHQQQCLEPSALPGYLHENSGRAPAGGSSCSSDKRYHEPSALSSPI